MEAPLKGLPADLQEILSHDSLLWMTGNCVWHSNRLWETHLLLRQFCCCSIPAACRLEDFSQLSACSGGGAAEGTQLGAVSLCYWPLLWGSAVSSQRLFSSTRQYFRLWNVLVPAFPWGWQDTFTDLCCVTASSASHFAASANITDDLTVAFSVYFFKPPSAIFINLRVMSAS